MNPMANATVTSMSQTEGDSIPIPAQISIPVQFQNGHIEMSGMDMNQQMSELDLNAHSPSPLPSINSMGGSARYVEYPPQRRGFGGQSYSGGPMMYSDSSYPQGTVFLGSYSNPMLTSWQYNPNASHQDIK